MSEASLSSPEKKPSLSFEEMQAFTAETADYDSESSEDILRRGLIEEAAEFAVETDNRETVSREKVGGELGDVLWYISETARTKNVDSTAIVGDLSLDEYQQAAHTITTAVYDKEGSEVALSQEPRAILAIAALRVIDVMNPKSDTLWRGHAGRVDLSVALRDLLTAVSYIASESGISLSESIHIINEKLQNRERLPHVIDEAQQEAQIYSERGRLISIHPLVMDALQ